MLKSIRYSPCSFAFWKFSFRAAEKDPGQYYEADTCFGSNPIFL